MQSHSKDYLWMQIVEYVLDKCCDIMVVHCRSNNAKLIFANDYWNGWQVIILQQTIYPKHNQGGCSRRYVHYDARPQRQNGPWYIIKNSYTCGSITLFWMCNTQFSVLTTYPHWTNAAWHSRLSLFSTINSERKVTLPKEQTHRKHNQSKRYNFFWMNSCGFVSDYCGWGGWGLCICSQHICFISEINLWILS